MNELPPGLRARILEEARSVPAATLSERRSGTLVGAALGAAALVLLGGSLGIAQKRASEVLLALAIGGSVSAFVATWVAAARGKSTLGRPLGALAAVAVVAPLSILVVATAIAGVDRGVVLMGGTTAQHLTCLGFTLLLALGPFAGLVYARRSSDPVHPRALGAALGAAAGAWGAAVIDVHCNLTTIEHLTLGHALPVALLAAVGALLGAKVLGMGARST